MKSHLMKMKKPPNEDEKPPNEDEKPPNEDEKPLDKIKGDIL